MIATVRRFASDESGATAIEYGLIAALISIAGAVALQSTGESLQGLFDGISEEVVFPE